MSTLGRQSSCDAGVRMLSDLEHTKHFPERRALADLPLPPHRVISFTVNRSIRG